jgi:hypothetical protein
MYDRLADKHVRHMLENALSHGEEALQYDPALRIATPVEHNGQRGCVTNS